MKGWLTSRKTISDLVQKELNWSLTNNVAPAVTDFSYSAERTTQAGTTPVSTSAFQVAAWNMYMGGWLPDTNFFYYSEFDIVTAGAVNPNLPNAYIGYIIRWGIPDPSHSFRKLAVRRNCAYVDP